MADSERWLSRRTRNIELSGVRRMFELARSLKDPVNLSIGQPHFPVPDAIKEAAKRAIDDDRNGYTVTQGVPQLRGKIDAWLEREYGHADRTSLVTSGTSGGLLLALSATVDPGDEVIYFDPYFVGYPAFVAQVGGVGVVIDAEPGQPLPVGRVAEAITPRTKAILFNTPANPTGAVPAERDLQALAELATEFGVLLISDEIYRAFNYDRPHVSPAAYNPQTLVVDGFGKTYGITGWRMGFAHGPRAIIEQMTKLQQFSFVCAPSIAQYGCAAAWDCDPTQFVNAYRNNRDRLCEALAGHYEFEQPGGAFYLYLRAPWGTATEFCEAAIRHNLLVIPGSAFSRRDTHVRVSFATDPATLERGIAILRELASPPARDEITLPA